MQLTFWEEVHSAGRTSIVNEMFLVSWRGFTRSSEGTRKQNGVPTAGVFMTKQDQSIVLGAAKEAEAEVVSQNEVSHQLWYYPEASSDRQCRISEKSKVTCVSQSVHSLSAFPIIKLATATHSYYRESKNIGLLFIIKPNKYRQEANILPHSIN